LASESLLGAIAILITTFSWSLAPVFVSRATQRLPSLDPLLFNAARMVFALPILVPLAVLLEGFPRVPWLDARFEAGVWIGGVLSTLVGDTLFVYSVSIIGASRALPISYLFIIWSAIYDYVTGAIGVRALFSAMLAFIAVWLVSRSTRKEDVNQESEAYRAVMAAVATSLIWAASLYAYKYATEVSGELSIAAARSIATVVVLAPLLPRIRTIAKVIDDTFLSSFFGYVLGTLSFLVALRLLPASIVGIGMALTPLLTQLLSAIMAHERLSKDVLTGGVLIALAIGLIKT
jgi:DME family drug/metabolite transporter